MGAGLTKEEVEDGEGAGVDEAASHVVGGHQPAQRGRTQGNSVAVECCSSSQNIAGCTHVVPLMWTLMLMHYTCMCEINSAYK